jgi:hypothetical protein
MPLALAAGAMTNALLKISILDTHEQRRLILEGKLIGPWIAELKDVRGKIALDPDDRELVTDVRNLSAIGEGENVLFELMNDGAKFCSGVFAKHVLKQLARRARGLKANQ